MAKAKRPNTAGPVFPNAGVEAWYRTKLQKLVRDMAQDMMDRVRDAWREGDGLAMDSTPKRAAGVIFRDGPLVLLLHRTDGLGWSWPGGGVEPGETWEDAARRECREEMSLTYEGPLTFVDVQTGPVRYVTFTAEVHAFTPTLNSEHDTYTWASRDAALALQLHPGVRATLTGPSMAADAKPSTPALLERALTKWGGLWTRRIEEVSRSIAWDFAVRNMSATDRAMVAKLSAAGFAVKFKPTKTARAAFDAVVAANVGLIRTIPQRYLSDVQASVWQAVMSGSDLATLTAEIQDKYGVAHRRAALIARDQNAKAKAAMERARRKEVGIHKAIWQHSHAGKEPRPSHVKMDGKAYDIDEGMYDPDEDAYIWPGTLIGCRCVDRAVIPGFE